jgi:preprotein translocase subunit SecE
VVYRGGLENRFGFTPNGGSNPSLSANSAKPGLPLYSVAKAGDYEDRATSLGSESQNYGERMTKTLIWVAVVVVIFGFLWWQGHLKRFAAYWQQTMEELKKCTWPTWDELKGSTVLVSLTILLLGLLTVVVDLVLAGVFLKL